VACSYYVFVFVQLLNDAVIVGCLSGRHCWCRKCARPSLFVGCGCD